MKTETPTFEINHFKDAVALLDRLKHGPNPWGKRRLPRYKTINGRRFQLHATRGWKSA